MAETEQDLSRRKFLRDIGVIAALTLAPTRALGRCIAPPSHHALDVIDVNKSITLAPANVRFAYATITWNGNDAQAIKDIAEVGFRGVQLRANAVQEYGSRPDALRALLAEHRLEMVALSSGNVGIAPGTASDEIAKHTRHAAFMHDVGGHYLQLIDAARPKDRRPIADDYKQLGHVMTEIGKRAMEFGIAVGYHHHMGALGQSPDDVDRVMNEADPRYVKLLLDVAHYAQGGGDPAKAIKEYRDRLLFLHIKDVESLAPNAADKTARAYRFVELGRGRVNLPAVFAALKKIKFRGWLVVELDGVPDATRTPKESAIISKRFIEETLKLAI
jgi:inosose dehydratase